MISSEMKESGLLVFQLFVVTFQLSCLPADEMTLDLADTGLQDKGNSPLISAEHWTLKDAFHLFTSGHVQF